MASHPRLNSTQDLAGLLRRGRALLNEHDPIRAHSEFGRWVEEVAEWLDVIDPALSGTWSGLPSSALVMGGRYDNGPDAWFAFQHAVRERLNWLGQSISAQRKTPVIRPGIQSGGKFRRVFVVHGHDEAARESVARFLERLQLQPIILHEQPNKGRTIIAKLREEAAEIGFAVIIMTPDDVGRSKESEENKPRARQNVVYELGFFGGVLPPDRVCALFKGDIERPSDFEGVLYISMDKEDWRTKLGQELQAAGYEIDWNKVMR